MISVIIPAFNEETLIKKCFEEVSKNLNKENIADYEIIFVDDGSKDNSWNEVKSIASADDRCRGIKFSRNFGKEAAIFAGLNAAKGDCCIIMDCDLQHPPRYLKDMILEWRNGFEIVQCVKHSRGKESVVHKIFAKGFFQLSRILMYPRINIRNSSDFKLLDRKVVDSILAFKEQSMFFRGVSAYVGFKSKDIEFDVDERMAGSTKWSYFSLIKYAVSNIVAFSTKPLQLVTFCGVMTFLFSLGLIIRTLYVWVAQDAAPGVSTVIITLSTIGSLLMICLGIIGYYIGKIYEEVRCRPRYILQDEV